MPVPSLEEQQEIISQVETRLTVVEVLEKTVRSSLKRAEALRKAILKAAYEGRLVPQDPNDESASVLLGRIQERRRLESEKKEKGKSESAKTSKRKKGAAMAKKSQGEPRSLIEVLKNAGDWITPEKLFTVSGHTDDSIDDFYEELKRGVENNLIQEKRLNKSEVFLKAADS